MIEVCVCVCMYCGFVIQAIGKIFFVGFGWLFSFCRQERGRSLENFLSELRGGRCRGGSVFDPKNPDRQVILMPPSPPPKKATRTGPKL